MPVSTPNAQYIENKPSWELVRDCVSGSKAVKARGTRYLPKPNPLDNSDENNKRYEAYKTRASFVNFTGHTKEGFNGMINRKEAEKELSPAVVYMEDNADGAGGSLNESMQRTIDELLQVAGHGLLVDFPQSDGGTQAQTAGLRATIKCYPAESILNWEETVIDGAVKTSMVVLEETISKAQEDDPFVKVTEKQYRVLKLEEGVYTQDVYDKNDVVVVSGITPRKSNGATWDEIPFVRAGAIDNSMSPDKSPLYDLAELNIAHYRNSADFEESSFLVGQPTPFIMGLSQSWVTDVMKGGVQLGSRTGILGPEGASAGLLQANENQMPSKGMEQKEAQMIKIGAKVITDTSGIETAEAAKIRFAGQNSKLGLIVINTELAYETCLDWADEFMGGTGSNEIEVNKQFYESSIDPQLLTAQIMLMDRNVITKADIRDNARKAGIIATDRTDEDIDNEAGEADPLE